MLIKVTFSQYNDYWVAEAENGAVSQGNTLEECRENIKTAIKELAAYENGDRMAISQKVETLEVAI